jgi:hypothetical protein
MNITLSADEKLIKKAREYAKARNTTLNQMIRDYLSQLVQHKSRQEAAKEFRRIAEESPGRSPKGWRFNRNKIHRYD